MSRLSAYKIWEMQWKKNILKFKVKWTGVKNVRFSTEKWPYLGNGERSGQGYCELLVAYTPL